MNRINWTAAHTDRGREREGEARVRTCPAAVRRSITTFSVTFGERARYLRVSGAYTGRRTDDAFAKSGRLLWPDELTELMSQLPNCFLKGIFSSADP